MNTERAGKGLFGQLCNRKDCLGPGATWFNHSTKLYYCAHCAFLINRANPEAVAEYGHKLCTEGQSELST